MKKFMKGLGVLAIAGALGLQTANVYAAESCGTGYKEHTDYYMFLNVDSASYFETNISKATQSKKTFDRFTSADKANNVLLNKVIDRGDIAITYGSRTTNPNAARTWTVEEYWKRSVGYVNNSNETYVFHNGWYDHTNALFNDAGVPRKGNENSAKNNATLKSYIKSAIDNGTLASSELVTKGTSYPNTVIGGGNIFGTTSNKTVRMTVARYFGDNDRKAGVSIGNSKLVYSPGAYFVTYCVPSNDDPVDPVPDKEYNVKYDGNGDNVTNVPKDQTVKENECFKVSHAPTRPGYKFVAWATSRTITSNTVKYAVGDEICNLKNDLTLYAIWEKEPTIDPIVEKYSIVYNPNTTETVTGMPGNEIHEVGKSATISTMIPVRPGWEFLGWNTDANATEGDPNYRGGVTYEDGKDLVLYAIWKKKDTPNPDLPDNPKTAVVDYLLPLGGTAGVSGACLGILKKKKSFKQF